MGADPQFVNGCHEHFVYFSWYFSRGVPPRATVKEMEDDRLVHEEQVALDLGIERVGKLDAADVSRAWFGPLSADAACLHDLGYELKDFICNANSFEEAPHRLVRRVPPSDMEFS